MKKLLLSAILFSGFAFGQSIEGLSVFKLNKFTPSDLQLFAKENKMQISECNSYKCVRSTAITKLSPNPDSDINSPSYSSYSPNVEVYQLNNYKINNEYGNSGVFLSFYKEKLYAIRVFKPDTKLIDDLEIKYGKGELSKTEGNDRCRINGESFQLPSVSYYTTWKDTERNVSMMSLLSKGRDYDCKESYSSSLSIIDKSLNQIAEDENRENKKQLEEKRKQERKQQLNNL